MIFRTLIVGILALGLPLNASALSLLTNGTTDPVEILQGQDTFITLSIADAGTKVSAIDLRIDTTGSGFTILPQDVRVGVVDPGTGNISIQTLPSPAQLPEILPDPDFFGTGRDRSTDGGLISFIEDYFPVSTFLATEAQMGFTSALELIGPTAPFDIAILLVRGNEVGANITLRKGLIDTSPGDPLDLFAGQVIATTIVPEPGTLVLLGAGLAGLSLLRRRRVS